MRRGDDIASRLSTLAVQIITVAERCPRHQPGRHVAGQLVRSATGAGSNYAEARGAESRRDFIHKLRIADKELRETEYWLGLVGRSWPSTVEDNEGLLEEVNELVAILSASIRTATRNDTDSS